MPLTCSSKVSFSFQSSWFRISSVKSRSSGGSNRYGRKGGKSITDKKPKVESTKAKEIVEKSEEEKTEIKQTTNIESRVAKIEKAIVKLVQMHEELCEKVDSLLTESNKANQNILDDFLDEKPSGYGFLKEKMFTWPNFKSVSYSM